MRLLRNILALTPCGKPQASHFAHVTGLLQWLPGCVNFTNLEYYGGRSARTHARWFARPFPFARLAVAALGALHPRDRWELLALDASFVAKSGDKTWGAGWFGSGMARAACWGLEVTLLAAVDVEEGGAYPLCARQSPGSVRSRRQACGTDTGRETALDAALALLGEAVAAGTRETLGARWVAVDGGYARRPFVEGVRPLDLDTVGRLRRDAVLRFPYLGAHERRPGRKRQFDGCFDRRDPARMTRTPLKKEKVDLYHGRLHAKAWQCRARVIHVLPRGADPETKEGVLLYSADLDLAPERIFRFHGARFQIEFAFRDAKQHLGLNDGQARSQARQHFHFNLVFAALFWARLQARLRAERPLGPFSLRARKRCNSHAFLDGVAGLGLGYLAEVARNTQVWTARPQTGGSPSRPRFSVPSQEVGTVADQLPPAAWRPFVLREGFKGPQAILCAVLRVVARRGPEPGPDVWLLLRRNPATDELKCYLSNGPADMAPDRLVWLAGLRWPIEQCFRDGKQLFGLGDYEGRSWQGWHRHATLVMLAHFFVVRETLRLKKSTPA